MKKEHWALLSLGINTLQALAKMIAGLLTGSLSMIGESFHSLSDSFASVITYLTLRFSEKKSEKFPYGLYKLENVGSIVIAIFLLLASVEIFKRAFG
ncbi:MAG: cation diffusion facilitator family transporter, partial [Hydrogenobacter sp.]